MPIYEYECTACNKRTELLQKLSDPPLETCPECKGPVRKIVSAAGLQFKGSGWYVTDYAKKNGQGPTPPNQEKKAESTSASENTPKKENTAKKESASKPSEKSKD